MPTTIKSIPPFFNAATTTAPPPFPPLLTDQQELLGKRSQPSGLLADEALHSKSGTPTAVVKPDSKLIPVPTGRPFKLARGSSPYPKRATSGKPHSGVIDSSSDRSDSSSEASSDSDEASSTFSEDSAIPKPPGEPGRPGRGGYNLETALDWNHKMFSKLKKLTHRLIDEHLDTTKCASMQNPGPLQLVRDKATAAIPDLENYRDCWPVNDIIMMRLKYTSGRARRQEIEIAAAAKGKKGAKK
ncbi:hypothetical protein JVT61DRAFT_13385 [Boletus reticuloceps]|uniref:Uncharacterized protein n=1 Tax=Boletus reticuloceps TaxID=495285 RepID=A0A8I3A3Y1_9AGAM|nr:hypothetical protein JVT61DRAFT_13385 [Boletus reticuloceps]